MVAKDVDILEASTSTILKLDTEKVADIRGSATAEFNSDGRRVVSCTTIKVFRRSNWSERKTCLRIPSSSGFS